MKKADGAVKRGRGLADGMAGREDERPPPGRLAAPVTVSCRATFLAFLIHQSFSNEEELVGHQAGGTWPMARCATRALPLHCLVPAELEED